jgi:hypothetical protein
LDDSLQLAAGGINEKQVIFGGATNSSMPDPFSKRGFSESKLGGAGYGET